MTRDEIHARLVGLAKSFSETIGSTKGKQRYWRPSHVLDLCDRFVLIRTALKEQLPSLFDDLPDRPVPRSSGTSDNSGEGYIEQQELDLFLRDVEYCLNVLAAQPSVSVPSLSVNREGIFFAGQVYDAFSRIVSIIEVAKNQIALIDSYSSAKLLDVFAAKPKGVAVKILTLDADPTLKAAAQSFNTQYGNLSIRLSNVFHDRFLIVDDNDFYHFGASLKDAGKRGFMFSRIEEKTIVDALQREFGTAWTSAKVVI